VWASAALFFLVGERGQDRVIVETKAAQQLVSMSAIFTTARDVQRGQEVRELLGKPHAEHRARPVFLEQALREQANTRGSPRGFPRACWRCWSSSFPRVDTWLVRPKRRHVCLEFPIRKRNFGPAPLMFRRIFVERNSGAVSDKHSDLTTAPRVNPCRKNSYMLLIGRILAVLSCNLPAYFPD